MNKNFKDVIKMIAHIPCVIILLLTANNKIIIYPHQTNGGDDEYEKP
jgi:hypothetical protein